jgi:ubiquinone/menaquinone biosynthesis C-methylase UbiE
MSIRKAYTHWAATYDSDRNLTRDLDEMVTRQILARQQYGKILELGCGTGKNTMFLAQIARHVYAFDFSEGMMQQAKAKLRHENIMFTITDFTQPLPCVGESIDLIVCNLVLEHIEDLTFIFEEVYRVLVKGGHFFLCELHPFKQYQGKKATFQRKQEQIEIPAFVHHLSSFWDAAKATGFTFEDFKEWWHEEDRSLSPRLASFMFEKGAN